MSRVCSPSSVSADSIGTISFRRLTRADLEALRRWLNEPHVSEWWGASSGPDALGGQGEHAATAEQVETKYGPTIDSEGTRHPQRPRPGRRVVSSETAAKLRTMLAGVVADGTGTKAAIQGYSVAGKTGTAKKAPYDEGKYIGSFVGFAPAESPRFAAIVVVDAPGSGEIYGGDIAAPVFSRIMGSWPAAFSRSQMGAVTRLCQTIALATGCPVALSQRMVVSRWLVTPIAARSPAVPPDLAIASRAVCNCEDQIASGSCSTWPGPGKIWGNSCCAIETVRPDRSNTMARLDVVPWSRARTKRLTAWPRYEKNRGPPQCSEPQ